MKTAQLSQLCCHGDTGHQRANTLRTCSVGVQVDCGVGHMHDAWCNSYTHHTQTMRNDPCITRIRYGLFLIMA